MSRRSSRPTLAKLIRTLVSENNRLFACHFNASSSVNSVRLYATSASSSSLAAESFSTELMSRKRPFDTAS